MYQMPLFLINTLETMTISYNIIIQVHQILCTFNQTLTILLNPSPCSHFFFAYEVAQSPHENSMWGANTRNVLARFGDNNWEKGEDFVKTFYVKKLVREIEGSLSARALDDV